MVGALTIPDNTRSGVRASTESAAVSGLSELLESFS